MCDPLNFKTAVSPHVPFMLTGQECILQHSLRLPLCSGLDHIFQRITKHWKCVIITITVIILHRNKKNKLWLNSCFTVSFWICFLRCLRMSSLSFAYSINCKSLRMPYASEHIRRLWVARPVGFEVLDGGPGRTTDEASRRLIRHGHLAADETRDTNATRITEGLNR